MSLSARALVACAALLLPASVPPAKADSVDPEFLAETAKLGMKVDARSRAELASIIARFMQTPSDLAAKAEALGHA